MNVNFGRSMMAAAGSSSIASGSVAEVSSMQCSVPTSGSKQSRDAIIVKVPENKEEAIRLIPDYEKIIRIAYDRFHQNKDLSGLEPARKAFEQLEHLKGILWDSEDAPIYLKVSEIINEYGNCIVQMAKQKASDEDKGISDAHECKDEIMDSEQKASSELADSSDPHGDGKSEMRDSEKPPAASRAPGNTNDYEVNQAICRNLQAIPAKLFTEVESQICMHRFMLNDHNKDSLPTFFVSVTVGNFDSIGNFFRTLFACILRSNFFEKENKNVNRNLMNSSAIQEVLLGIEQGSEQYQHLIRGFKRNARIILYISVDVQFVEIRVDPYYAREGYCPIF